MDETNVLSAPKAVAKGQVSSWMSSKNHYLSAVLEQHVTNKQMLLICHCLVAFCSMIVCFGSNFVLTSCTFIWFLCTLLIAQRGGLK